MKNLYQDLEFDKIKQSIADKCHSDLGRAFVKTLVPGTQISEIEQNLVINSEIQSCVQQRIGFNFEELVDIAQLFDDQNATVFGFEEFLNVYHNVLIANLLASAAKGLDEYPRLSQLLSKIKALPELCARFTQIFDAEGEVLDNASPELARIRRQTSILTGRIQKLMQNLLNDAGMEKYLQDKFITQRNDRYVIPVKESAGPYVKGIVQSRSATKATVFIEPEAAVPLSNELQLLRQEEKSEIYRIFLEYTTQIRAFSRYITRNTELCAQLDFRFAIGRLCNSFTARMPKVCSEAKIKLYGARHPLLCEKMGNLHKVIPFDIELGNDYRLLILSGPNTGGKTVLLKAVGLISLMALSGIPVPVGEDSEIGLFENVFADIGDDQSIENALSTFSSHIDKIKRMLNNASLRSLVLIDEIGAATDPEQGSALAQVILESFVQKGVLGIFTTHYTSLKVFAESAEGCTNASMQFDTNNLLPTYRFVTGFPGDSFAIEVAASLGLDSALIERAKQISGSQSVEFTELLKTMQELKKSLAREQYEFQLKNRNLQARIEELDNKNQGLEAEIKLQKKQHYKELQRELIALQKAYTSELNDIRSMDKEERKHRSEGKIGELDRQQQEIKQKIRELNPQDRAQVFAPKIGDLVWVEDFETDAILIDINGSEATVDMNGITFKTRSSSLYATDKKPEVIPLIKTQSSAKASVKLELKLLGLTFDEAQPLIDEALDEVIVAGFHSLRIVHGKGTGALRAKVQAYLRSKKQVISISTPPPEAGGSGVTIANV